MRQIRARIRRALLLWKFRKQNARIAHIINHATIDSIYRDAQVLKLHGVPVGVAFGMLERAIVSRRKG